MNKGGRKETSNLFKEEGDPNAPYSLERFREVFISQADSTGYLCAQIVLDCLPAKDRWTEWSRLFSNTKLCRILETWREEMEVFVKANAETKVALGCDSKDFTRLRYLLDRDLPSDGKRKAGRPSKEQQTKRQKIQDKARRTTPEEMDNVIGRGTWDKTDVPQVSTQ